MADDFAFNHRLRKQRAEEVLIPAVKNLTTGKLHYDNRRHKDYRGHVSLHEELVKKHIPKGHDWEAGYVFDQHVPGVAHRGSYRNLDQVETAASQGKLNHLEYDD